MAAVQVQQAACHVLLYLIFQITAYMGMKC